MSKGFSETKRKIIFNKFYGRCAYCGTSVEFIDMHIDHITPKKEGGNNELRNLNPSCAKCNTTKGDRSLEDFRLHSMLGSSRFKGIINFKQWQSLNDLGVFINLPTHIFHFEDSGHEQSCN
ncbi:HNH endonuclease [Erwinia tracheiphila]|uniref:HNH nuclease domain-containing protein n=1 Tax=Erwinia tracheiphila TaxID=65700 RepID=A0A0M2KI54_9GAMM|nr:HNH endonuclease [Erwinia tracheiphila]EOS94737.1 hypothetical protein ETR_12203 [Erwinia tracheiphila PSU-1]KKF36987.1 hypothetical protein SY86_18630 [Erwinia tracheiphila]UIA88335.1 HNH endonuclease [Erwinia tracheiphila]UIA96244.1 HNH endonuclease [Erwinia tracheiphila]